MRATIFASCLVLLNAACTSTATLAIGDPAASPGAGPGGSGTGSAAAGPGGIKGAFPGFPGPGGTNPFADGTMDGKYKGAGKHATDPVGPATERKYPPNPAAPNWDYRVVYEAWINSAAFSGPARAFVDHVHASPSKLSSDTLYISPGRCPTEW